MRQTIRELKRLHNFSSQTTDEDVVEKTAIINRVLFGDDESEWKSPEELLTFLSDIADSTDDEKTGSALSQLVDVLNYLTGNGDRPASLAVYEPADIVSVLVSGGKSIDYVKFIKDTIIDPLLSEGKFLKKETKNKFEETMKALPFSQEEIKQTVEEHREAVADALTRYQVKTPEALSDRDKFYWLCWAELRTLFKDFYREKDAPKQPKSPDPYRSIGGYREDGAWSNRADNALHRGLRPAAMIAKDLGVSSKAYEEVMDKSEWHHVGGFDEVNFYDPDEAPYCLHAKDIKDKSDVEDYFKICKMREIDLPNYKEAYPITGITDYPDNWQQIHKNYYDTFHTPRQNLPSQKLVEEFEDMLYGDSWDLEEAKRLAQQVEDQQNKEKKDMEKAYKDFFSDPINKKYFKPIRKSQATRVKSLRY